MEKTNIEEWRFVRGTDERYMVSNSGEIVSLYARRNVNGHPTERYMPRKMTASNNGNGYFYIDAKIHNKRIRFYVHRAVAEAFIEKPEGKDYINHIDYNRSNNDVSNLEWCTQKENVKHSLQRMRHPRKITNQSTGYKYIGIKTHHKKKYYRVKVKGKVTDKLFKELKDAVEYRDKELGIIYDFNSPRLEPWEVAESCVECGNPIVEHHHCIYGIANRKLSDKYGFVIPLCKHHHKLLHANPNTGIDLKWKQTAQHYYETFYGSRENFIKEFGRSWII